MEKVGGVNYTAEDIEFAKKMQATFDFKVPSIEAASTVQKLNANTGEGSGSTDVGDVSYVVPTVGLSAATWVPGTPAHSWQATACGGTDIGIKGLMVAAKTMTLTAIDLFTNPDIIIKAKQEFTQAIGNYKYEPLLGDRKPALNYRD